MSETRPIEVGDYVAFMLPEFSGIYGEVLEEHGRDEGRLRFRVRRKVSGAVNWYYADQLVRILPATPEQVAASHPVVVATKVKHHWSTKKKRIAKAIREKAGVIADIIIGAGKGD